MSGVLPLRSLHAFMVSCLGTEAALPYLSSYVVAFVITIRTIAPYPLNPSSKPTHV
jgi:hypothetical protein